jgi:ABC-type spermidine/putrescine transport system permease subunit II
VIGSSATLVSATLSPENAKTGETTVSSALIGIIVAIGAVLILGILAFIIWRRRSVGSAAERELSADDQCRLSLTEANYSEVDGHEAH